MFSPRRVPMGPMRPWKCFLMILLAVLCLADGSTLQTDRTLPVRFCSSATSLAMSDQASGSLQKGKMQQAEGRDAVKHRRRHLIPRHNGAHAGPSVSACTQVFSAVGSAVLPDATVRVLLDKQNGSTTMHTIAAPSAAAAAHPVEGLTGQPAHNAAGGKTKAQQLAEMREENDWKNGLILWVFPDAWVEASPRVR